MSEFDFDVVHRAGAKHANADALSRNPIHPNDHTEASLEMGEVEAPWQMKISNPAEVLATVLSMEACKLGEMDREGAEFSVLQQLGDNVKGAITENLNVGMAYSTEHIVADAMQQDLLMKHSDANPGVISLEIENQSASDKKWASELVNSLQLVDTWEEIQSMKSIELLLVNNLYKLDWKATSLHSHSAAI